MGDRDVPVRHGRTHRTDRTHISVPFLITPSSFLPLPGPHRKEGDICVRCVRIPHPCALQRVNGERKFAVSVRTGGLRSDLRSEITLVHPPRRYGLVSAECPVRALAT